MKPKLMLSALCSASILSALATDTRANDDAYPSRPVSIITHVAAGSGPDVIARIVADRLTSLWGKQVIIVNRQSAAGLIAGQAAASARPDGYTLYLPTVSGLILSPAIQPKFPVDMEHAFAPIGQVASTPMIIAVSPALGVETLADFVALAKKRPDGILYAANNRGSFPHLTAERLRNKAGIELTFVPYPGAAAALRDVLGGTIAMMVESPSALAGAIESGSLKALAVTSASRLPNFPNLATVSETIPGFVAAGWFAFLAPVGTPDAIIQKITQDLHAILNEPAVSDRLEQLGVYARPMLRAETAEFIRSERQLWQAVIKEAGLAPR
jgi:tripartite-type tricarboxylate transporter receptor subunit TctC